MHRLLMLPKESLQTGIEDIATSTAEKEKLKIKNFKL